jgi:hypothetical protein
MGEDHDIHENVIERNYRHVFHNETLKFYTFFNNNSRAVFEIGKTFDKRSRETKYHILLSTEDPQYAPDVFFTRFFDELEMARLKWITHVEERNSAYALARTGRMAAGPQQALDVFAMHQYGTSAREAKADINVSGEMEARDYSRMYSEALSNHRLFEGGRRR